MHSKAKYSKAKRAVAAAIAFMGCPGVLASPGEDIASLLNSEEFKGHSALTLINAPYAYEAGASGKGVVIAFIDTGLDPAHPDIMPNLSKRSADMVGGRGRLKGSAKFGEEVAILAAGAFNQVGTMGVAYEATILAIRADVRSPGRACSFSSRNESVGDFKSRLVAIGDSGTERGDCPPEFKRIDDAIDYAVANGADILNLSAGAGGQDPNLLKALRRTADAGVIAVAAGGSDGASQTNDLARLAKAKGVEGMMVAVGSHNAEGEQARHANRAGDVRDYFITAPGESTSTAAAYVSGSLALMRQAFPELSPNETVEALLLSARDAGAPGVDRIYGRGLLDLKSAFEEAQKKTDAKRIAE